MPRARASRRTDETEGATDPDRLIRQQAGTYRSADERFEVREADVGWFLVDSQQSNEFGQELIQGPFATLKSVRSALPDARAATPMVLNKPKAKPKAKPREKAAPKSKAPPHWIDLLPKSDAADARRLIGALEREGITDADALVRRDREGLLPAVASRLVERRLEELLDDLPAPRREEARALLRRAAEILTAEGTSTPDPLPGWTLVELGGPKAGPEPPNRRIDLRK